MHRVFRIINIVTISLCGLMLLLLGVGLRYSNGLRTLAMGHSIAPRIPFQPDGRSEPLWLSNTNALLYVYTDQTSYGAFEKIYVIADFAPKPRHTDAIQVQAQLQTSGQTQVDILGRKSVPLRYIPSQDNWQGVLLLKNPLQQGDAQLISTATFVSMERPVQATNTLYLTGVPQTSPSLERGMYMGIYSTELFSRRTILSPANKESSWESIPTWIETLDLDGIMVLGGVSKSFQTDTSVEQPWDIQKINEVQDLSSALADIQRDSAVWIRGFHVEGSYLERMGYQASVGLGAGGVVYSNTHRISPTDPSRLRQLISLGQSFDSMKGVRHVGFEYLVGSNLTDLQLFPRYLSDTGLEVPAEWPAFTQADKIRFAADQLQNSTQAQAFGLWKLYEMHIYAKQITDALSQSSFYITRLSEAREQALIIPWALSSGFDTVAMSVNMAATASLQDALERIQPYARQTFLAWRIDYDHFQTPSATSAIQAYIYAHQEALAQTDGNLAGFVVDDLYTIMTGKRGPYSPYEWLLGVARLNQHIKTDTQGQPLQVQVYLSAESLSRQQTTQLHVSIANASMQDVENLEFRMLPVLNTDNANALQSNQEMIPLLPQGQKHQFTWSLTVPEINDQYLQKKVHFLGYQVTYTIDEKRYYLTDFIPVQILN